MNKSNLCSHWGICHGCALAPISYDEQISYKIEKLRNLFNELPSPLVYTSLKEGYRGRIEFGIWHDDEEMYYIMHTKEGTKVRISECPIVHPFITKLLTPLLELLKTNRVLRYRLFGVNFLTSTQGEVLITLTYHKKLDIEWEKEATVLASILGVYIIGRSRGQKVVIGQEWIEEKLTINERTYSYRYDEGAFSQPNVEVNQKMIYWAIEQVKKNGWQEQSLIELYCGAGNFTFPFSAYFHRVVATEVSKASVRAALWGIEKNSLTNVDIVRLSAEEFSQSLDGVTFNRLGGISLPDVENSVIFVDPPRAGLDDTTRALLRRFYKIIYISCNPETLKRDFESLLPHYRCVSLALFDQFPYTHHCEVGMVLEKVS